MPVQLKRNDTKDIVSYLVTNLDGTVVNLTGASVKFVMGKGNTLITYAAATIVNPSGGSVEYTLTEDDTLLAGAFQAEFEVTFSDGKIKTFPSDGYISVNIKANIDKDKSTYAGDTIALRVSDIEVFKTDINAQMTQASTDAAKVNLFQAQIDQLVIQGDSSVEAAQARVEADGTVNATLQARLNKKEAETKTSLAQKAKQSDVDAALLLKRDKSAKITNTDVESTTDANKLKLANLAQEVINSMTGTTPVNNANPANSSVTLPTIASDTRDKINYGITAREKPCIWTGGSVTKTTTSFTLAGNVGLLVGKGVNLYITPVSFTGIQAGEVLVIRGLDLDTQADYLGTTNPKPILLKVWHYQITGSDIVIAWKDDRNVYSIYDEILGNDDTNYNGKFDTRFNSKFFSAKYNPWMTDTSAIVTKTSSSVTFSGNVGLIYNQKFTLFNAATISLSSVGSCLVARGIDFTQSYDGTTNPKITLQSVFYTTILQGDIVIAVRDGQNIWTIYDDYIAKNAASTAAPQSKVDSAVAINVSHNNLLTKCYPELAKKMLAKVDTVNVLLAGDSIFATGGAWVQNVYDETKRFTTLLATANAEPLGLTDGILSRKIYETLTDQALNVPIYRRFDYGRTFDYNSASGTYGQDITAAGIAFFTETGAFNTFVNSNGNKGTDVKYNANVPMTKADFNLQSYDGASWYNSLAMEGFTRITKDAGASVQFIVPAGYKKARIKLRIATDGDILTTTLVNCTGAVSIDTNYGAVTHNNNSAFKDIEFVITDTAQTATITLTKSSNITKRLMYWGCYYFNEPAVLVTNYAYGGSKTYLNKDVLPEALSCAGTPDLVIWELMLINDYYNSGYSGPETDYTSTLANISAYADMLATYNKIAIIPHQGTLYSNVKTKELWNKAKKILIDKNIPFIDLSSVERQVLDYFGSRSAMDSYMYKDSFVHPSTNGVNILKAPLQAVCDINEFFSV
jgi:hypothetical protein